MSNQWGRLFEEVLIGEEFSIAPDSTILAILAFVNLIANHRNNKLELLVRIYKTKFSMHIKKNYTAFEMAWWTRFETFLFIGIITAWVAMYVFLDLGWLKIPWTPLALIGTAVAFVIGFQNNSAYGRIWEARKIWGGIINTSRTFGTFVQDMVNNEYNDSPLSEEELQKEIQTLTYRHIAWITALRHSMRESKPWETSANHKTNQEWDTRPPEFDSNVEEEPKPFISNTDLTYAMSKDNKQTALLYLQSHYLKELKQKGAIWEFLSWN